jgi:TPR repeat protein
VELYERAAASGSVPALNGLGFAYFNGHHLPQVVTHTFTKKKE